MSDEQQPGRPRMYSDPEAFDAMVDAYVAHCQETRQPLTYTGLALYLGFSSRTSIDEYLRYAGFSNSVMRAKAIVEQGYEARLHGSQSAGAQFALMNYGWSRHQTVDHRSGDGSMTPRGLTDAELEKIAGGD